MLLIESFLTLGVGDFNLLTLCRKKRKRVSVFDTALKPKNRCTSSSLTFDTEHGGALCPTQRVLRGDAVLADVFGPHSQDQHGANPTRVGDVVVGIGVQTDVIAIPCDTRLGVAAHRAAHVAFVAFGRGVKLQRNDECRSAPQVTVPHGRQAYDKLFWKANVSVKTKTWRAMLPKDASIYRLDSMC